MPTINLWCRFQASEEVTVYNRADSYSCRGLILDVIADHLVRVRIWFKYTPEPVEDVFCWREDGWHATEPGRTLVVSIQRNIEKETLLAVRVAARTLTGICDDRKAFNDSDKEFKKVTRSLLGVAKRLDCFFDDDDKEDKADTPVPAIPAAVFDDPSSVSMARTAKEVARAAK